MKKAPKNKKDSAQEKIEQLEIEVSILRGAYFQLEKAISERKKTEEKLKVNEKKFRSLFETANDMIQNVRPDGGLVDVNSAWCTTLGYTKQEALKMNLMDIIHPESQKHCMELFKKVMSGKPVKDIEAEFVTKKGKVIVVNGNASCIFKDGKPGITWGVFRNVTERKEAEKELKKSAIYIDAMGEALMVLDMQRRVVKLNKAGLKLWGYTEKESLGLTFEDIIPKREHKKQYVLMQEGMKTGAIDPFETSIVTKEGKEIPVLLSGTVLKDDSGKPTGFTGVFRDITERKKAEHNLNERMKELTIIYETSRVMEGNDDLNKALSEIVEAIPPAYQFPEITCARIIFDGKEYKTGNFKKTKWRQFAKIKLAGREPGGIEVFYLEKKSFLVEEKHMLGEVAAQVSNITERKRAEGKLKARTEELERMNKLMIGRELRMIGLKKALRLAQGKPSGLAQGETTRTELRDLNNEQST